MFVRGVYMRVHLLFMSPVTLSGLCEFAHEMDINQLSSELVTYIQ